VRAQCPNLRYVIGIDAGEQDGCNLTMAELEQRAASFDSLERARAWERDALAVQPDDLATLIYTSGTTGAPKGVMLTHDNFHSNVVAARKSVPFDRTDLALSFLPLSHVFERMGDYMYFSCGTSIAYVASIDDVPLALQEIKPTMAMGVPRLYEKMYARVLENAKSGGALKWRIFGWARAVAYRWADERLAGRTPGGLLARQYALAQKLVFSKLQERTGGRMRYFVSGGAPLAPEINKFFYAAGHHDPRGLRTHRDVAGDRRELALGVPDRQRRQADRGRRGPHRPLRRGAGARRPDPDARPARDARLLQRPEGHREAVDADGWFNTGDIGRLEDGYLRITDRAKDIIVTAGGKNIAPQPIENAVKTNKFVSQAVVIGDKRKFPVLLVVPNWDSVEKWAKDQNLLWTERRQLLSNPAVTAMLDQEVRGRFAHLAKFETPKKIAWLEHDFTIERGELTPKLSVKRRVIDKAYKDVIDGLYADEGAAAD
jgi:long-chain acyl-CoA synthetase